jgi:glycosyltransferase involved in cell wall biosynthesis
MHICFITNEYPKLDFPHGGVGTFIHTIAHKLIAKDHKVSVIGINVYTKIDEEEKDGEVSVFRFKPKVVKGLTWYFNNQTINKKLKDLNKEEPIDIVETAELGLSFIKKNRNSKYIIRLHGGHHFFAESENRKVSWWKGFQEKKSFKNADAFVAVSKYVKSHTAVYLSYHNKPIKIIRYPINLDVFKPKPEIEIENNTILFAGTVCEKKGINQLLLAMPKVIENNKETQLYIYGRDWYFPDGKSYITHLKNSILPKLGSAVKHIHFMGAVPFKILANKYAAAQVCIFPSLMETQGLVAPEAMAMNKLVIFSECGPGPETIEHKKTGLLCNPYDSDDIANQINWALTHNEDCSTIAKAGMLFVENTFNLEQIANKNLEFYNLIKEI